MDRISTISTKPSFPLPPAPATKGGIMELRKLDEQGQAYKYGDQRMEMFYLW